MTEFRERCQSWDYPDLKVRCQLFRDHVYSDGREMLHRASWECVFWTPEEGPDYPNVLEWNHAQGTRKETAPRSETEGTSKERQDAYVYGTMRKITKPKKGKR